MGSVWGWWEGVRGVKFNVSREKIWIGDGLCLKRLRSTDLGVEREREDIRGSAWALGCCNCYSVLSRGMGFSLCGVARVERKRREY